MKKKTIGDYFRELQNDPSLIACRTKLNAMAQTAKNKDYKLILDRGSVYLKKKRSDVPWLCFTTTWDTIEELDWRDYFDMGYFVQTRKLEEEIDSQLEEMGNNITHPEKSSLPLALTKILKWIKGE